MTWTLRLVETGAESEGPRAEVVEISWVDGIVDIADLGLTLAKAKLVMAGGQRKTRHRISDRRDGRLDGIAIVLKPVGVSK